ncbi:hypothetical protein [Aquipseudomonas alcaligenes]|uniref:Uncharacterized protein n=1 Tax=Aquipseudomonas alcaligenes (strain ATCC 14909 / DSM 50342 / CCUG 1425 / JCM 20561 / NBRC 14159 / NCIMB 9945 / NCTC 10367 / 1577) TaxID=1215092 RepID=U2ZTS7_AQUA1|nr:hypothetical protein [Pseudomonas alcaligenes]GAD64830.1 hypothetical protein PA6_049_00190 [Pseudomonas alcaligenes NBRC 14159]
MGKGKSLFRALLGLVGGVLLFAGAMAAEAGPSPSCDLLKNEAATPKNTLTWRKVEPARILEADYYGRIFEANFDQEGSRRFLYKVIYNISGQPAYVSVALLDHSLDDIDVKKIRPQAIFLLEEEARKVVSEGGAREAYGVVHSGKDISIWSLGSGWYFSLEWLGRLVIFELASDRIKYACFEN